VMEINQITLLVALFGIYSSSGEYFQVFRKVSLKIKRSAKAVCKIDLTCQRLFSFERKFVCLCLDRCYVLRAAGALNGKQHQMN
jgi:hypothetical protein